MNTDWYWEDRGAQDWIDDIRRELLQKNYTNRSRLQKQLLVLERAKDNMYKARHNLSG